MKYQIGENVAIKETSNYHPFKKGDKVTIEAIDKGSSIPYNVVGDNGDLYWLTQDELK